MRLLASLMRTVIDMDWFANIDVGLVIVIVVVLLCLVFEGFFSGTELAIVACDKLRLKQRSANGNRGAKTAEWFIDRPVRLFSITLLGTNLSTITASTVLTFYLIKTYGAAYGSFAIFLSPIILIFAEILPKSIYHHHANTVVDKAAPALMIFRSILYPAVYLVQQMTDRLLRGARRAYGKEKRITREELALIIQGEETKGSDIKQSERTMAARVLRLAAQKAKNVMKPLVEMETLPIHATRDAAFAMFDLKGYSMIPVYSNRVFDVIGTLDAIDVLCAESSTPLKELIHEPVYVPEEMPINELFRLLREKRERTAVVVDEYGGAVGIVTMEDICEEVVGEIRDEFELDAPLFRIVKPRHYLVNARMETEIAAAQLGVKIPAGDFETIAGMLLTRFGHIPKVGESIKILGWVYTVRLASDRSVQEVEVVGEPEGEDIPSQTT